MKKTVSIFLALLIVFSLAHPARAASDANGTGFSDVRATAWYAAAVTYAASVGFAVGSDGKFRPDDPVTRGEFVSMLSRILLPEGIPEEIPASPFADVPPHKYYARPIAWAYFTGITEGIDETHFCPNDTIRRQDMAAMLYRAEQLPELGALPYVADEIVFRDEKSISDYAREAVKALQRQGLLVGDTDGYSAEVQRRNMSNISILYPNQIIRQITFLTPIMLCSIIIFFK